MATMQITPSEDEEELVETLITLTLNDWMDGSDSHVPIPNKCP